MKLDELAVKLGVTSYYPALFTAAFLVVAASTASAVKPETTNLQPINSQPGFRLLARVVYRLSQYASLTSTTF